MSEQTDEELIAECELELNNKYEDLNRATVRDVLNRLSQRRRELLANCLDNTITLLKQADRITTLEEQIDERDEIIRALKKDLNAKVDELTDEWVELRLDSDSLTTEEK